MKSDPLDIATANSTTPPSGLLKWLLNRLQRAGVKGLRVQLDSRKSTQTVQLGDGPVEACLQLHKPRAIWRAITGGMMGWAEGYMAGDWTTPDLRALCHWAAANEHSLKQAFQGGPVSHWLNRMFHRARDNSRQGSRRNIASHYDLGNDFYALWLDPTFSYSSALFNHPQQPLADAQQAKYDRILQLTQPQPNQQYLEIGCGWGGFAETIARAPHNLHLHGVTLSAEQLAFAQQRMQTLPGGDNVQLEYLDYRDIQGPYDRVVSIEMFEAVGEAHWPTFFNKLYEVLAPGGTAVLQIICIAEEKFDHYRQHTDFIQRYIFPGGMLPTVSAVQQQATQHGLELGELQHFGPDYARTLQHWHDAFEQNWPAIEAQGFDQRFRRMWRYYLAYCESGFRSGALDVCLFQLHKPNV